MSISFDVSQLEEDILKCFNKDKQSFISKYVDDNSIEHGGIIPPSMDEMYDYTDLLKIYIEESMRSSVNFMHDESAESLAGEIRAFEIGRPGVWKSADGSIDIYIDMWSPSSTYRPSLNESVFGGIDNILLLFNNGYYAEYAYNVRGEWHGRFVNGKVERNYTGFLENGIKTFNDSAAANDNGVRAFLL